MVNSKLEIYLTDFVESTFAGEIAKNRDFCGGDQINRTRVYYSGINYTAAFRNLADR